jgi:asparagine synthase (glutamine-hydrolysing)
MKATARAMADALSHRGPDDHGVWADPEAGVALGHRRLSIIDLSQSGHQPMLSRSERYVIVYNGEIYNFATLRTELAAGGVSFRGNSDTEVLLEACAAWGVEATVKRLIGMFAFGLWDRQERTLTLVRDRMGIKPLYWGQLGGLFLFGSELKALRAHPGWSPNLDRNALAAYLRFAYVPSPHCIYQGIQKLMPGHILTLMPDGRVDMKCFWELRAVAREGTGNPLHLSDQEATDRLDSLLRDAVAGRMISDVSIGAFLSGGIDFSVIVALMQAQSDRPVKTFSIGFDEAAYNEALHAKAVAEHLGTDHTELYLRSEDARAVIPKLPQMYDEPFADSSQIPTFLVSEMTRRHVTVALSGDGGDELFAGYTRFLWAAALWRYIGWVPQSLRGGIGKLMQIISTAGWDRLLGAFPDGMTKQINGIRLHKLTPRS